MNRSEASARAVGELLAARFLKEGYYKIAGGAVHARVGAAAALADAGAEIYVESTAFAGLEVQAVAHEVGTESPRVFVYLIRGSAKLIKSLPTTVAGIPIVARKMGTITVRPDAAATNTNRGNFYERNARVCCGSSCAPASENSSGTLGAVVRMDQGAEMFVLSNNHVLAGCNHVIRDQPILSPSNNDGRAGISAPREIARHARISPLRSGVPDFVSPCVVDVALARVTDPNVIASWQGDSVDGYDTPTQVVAPETDMRVKKFGRTTGLTYGHVEAEVDVALPVAYRSKHFTGTVWFERVWSVRPEAADFAALGDSGSLVVTEDGSRAVGLIFAASPVGDAWMIPIGNIAAEFPGLTLLSRHGVT